MPRPSSIPPAFLMAVALLPWGTSQADPVAPGHIVTVYAAVTDPSQLAFDANGYLYVGRDNSGSGGGNADSVKIHRIPPGGGSFATYGLTATFDPDAVGVDRTGAFTGAPGSILVAGRPPATTIGVISSILPDQSVSTLWTNLGFVNPSDLEFDAAGHLWFSDYEGTNLWRSTGGLPEVAFSPGAGARDIAFQAVTGNVYLRFPTLPALRLYSPSGVLLSTLSTSLPGNGLAIAPPGPWGSSPYVGSGTTVVRVDGPGSTQTVASGFAWIWDVIFGPDGAMYVSDFSADRVYRISATATTDVTANGPPARFRLNAYPAPVSHSGTRLRFELGSPGRTTLRIVDAAGRLVRVILDEARGAGPQEASWDGNDARGRRAEPGVYLAVLEAGEAREAARLVVLH